MQRGLVNYALVAGFFLIIFLQIVSAGDYTCIDDKQRIFRISAFNNSHGELYNGAGNYVRHICYDDHFGTFAGTPTRTPCIAGNVVIRLNGTTNAHAEIPGRTTVGYQDVCFDETLSCSSVAVPITCPTLGAGYKEIASLSAVSNAHIGVPQHYNASGNFRICCRVGSGAPQCSDGADNDADGASDYPNDFSCANAADNDETTPLSQCQDGIDNDGDTRIDWPADPGCTSRQDNDETGGAENFTQTQWQNNAGDPIGRPYSVNSSVNVTVRMAAWTRFPVGTNLTFEVWEKDPISDDYIRNFTTLTYMGTPVSVGAIFNYRISDADIEAGRSQPLDQDAGEEYEEFYFKVHTTNGLISSEVNLSYIVDVSVAMAPNNPPVANITAPTHRGVYYNGTTVLFNQSSYDFEGGNLSYYWTIPEDNFNSTQRNFSYQFRSPGQKTVTLRVTDERGAWSEDQVGIIVVASPGLFAYINKPEHLALLVNRTLRVIVNANDSYAINSQGTCPTITVTCIAGVCPTQTQNSPCGPGTIPITGGPRGFNELYFDWGFSDGDSAPAADGLGNVTVDKQFGQPSGSLTDYKRADLRLNYTNASVITGGISIQFSTNRFFTLLDAHQCIDDGRTWVEYNYTTGEIIETWPTLVANNRCTGRDGISGSDDDCCPSRHTCTGTPLAACAPVNESRCSDYRAENPCDDDIFNVVETDENWDNECETGQSSNGSIVTCSCKWTNESQTTGDYCRFNKQYRQGSGGGGCTPHSCTYLPTTEPTECVNGYAMVTVQAQFAAGTCTIPPASEANATCMAGTGQRTILCGRPTISLDFFGPWQFIITFVAILAVYWVWWLRKRR